MNLLNKALIVFFRDGPVVFVKKSLNLLIVLKSNRFNQNLNQDYQKWLQKKYPKPKDLNIQKELIEKFSLNPKISLITPTYNTPIKLLIDCIDSVQKQSYENWELCFADDASTQESVRKSIKEYSEHDVRIKYIFRKKNGHISEASNSALGIATGEFVGFLDHDDVLWPNALYEVVKKINDNPKLELIYSDEDKLNEDGETHSDPFFKPDWSPDYLRSINYITHFAVLKKNLVDKIGRFRVGVEGAQDWDLFLRATRGFNSQAEEKIGHIATVLYSWRKSRTSTASGKTFGRVKDYAYISQKKALEDDLKARGYDGKVLETQNLGNWRVKYLIKDVPLVSIIIPTKDKFEYLNKCINSVLTSTYRNIELVIVDTGSTDKRLENLYRSLKERVKKIEIINWKREFNFSAVCNFGAKNATGDYFLFLNNDTEVISKDWIESLLEHSQRKEIGAVGCKLLYPNKRVQSAGLILGLRGIAYSPFWNFEEKFNQFLPTPTLNLIRNFSAVTAACLMVSKDKFELVGGFEENFRIAFNDLDFCLKLRKRGFFNLYTPFARLYHHESVSVGKLGENGRDLLEFDKEVEVFKDSWGKYLEKDPYYNVNLSLENEAMKLKAQQ